MYGQFKNFIDRTTDSLANFTGTAFNNFTLAVSLRLYLSKKISNIG